MPQRKVNKKGPFNLVLGYLGLVIDTVLEVMYALKTELVMVACTLALIGAIQSKGVDYTDALTLPTPQIPPTVQECIAGLNMADALGELGLRMYAELKKVGEPTPETEAYFKGLKKDLQDQVLEHCPMLEREEDNE